MNIIKYIDMSMYFINNLYIIKYRINTKQYWYYYCYLSEKFIHIKLLSKKSFKQ